jgi:hypothetical protein
MIKIKGPACSTILFVAALACDGDTQPVMEASDLAVSGDELDSSMAAPDLAHLGGVLENSTADPWLAQLDSAELAEVDTAPDLALGGVLENSTADPWLAQLDSAELAEFDTGVALIGYAADGAEIGRVSMYVVGEMILINHLYPRACEPGESEEGEPCADAFLIAVHGDDAGVTSNAPPGVFDGRVKAMVASLESTKAWDVPCAVTLAATAAMCGMSFGVWPAAVGCLKGAYDSACTCKKIRKQYPGLDEVCPK